MIFPGFPGVLSFFQVFQVEWEPCFQNQKYQEKYEENNNQQLKVMRTRDNYGVWYILAASYPVESASPPSSLLNLYSARAYERIERISRLMIT